jgi:hypothetical protein
MIWRNRSNNNNTALPPKRIRHYYSVKIRLNNSTNRGSYRLVTVPSLRVPSPIDNMALYDIFS